MESRARAFGHPIHQILIVFPLGLLATSLVFDILFLISKSGEWAIVSFWMTAAGVIGGLIAAPFGLVDWLAIPAGTRAKTIGAWHGIGNVVVLVLFAVSWFLRRGETIAPSTLTFVLSLAGVLVALGAGWLGGELVDRLGVGVYDDANVDAPSSLAPRGRQRAARVSEVG